MNPDRIDNLLTGIPEGELRSIVPAFFVVDAPAEAADEAASACAEDLNDAIRDVAHPNAARVRLLLCEESRTSEIPASAALPNSLTGFTCDALPRVDTTAALDLIREISLTEAGGNSDPDVMARALDNIVGKAQGFIRDADLAIEAAAANEGFGLVLADIAPGQYDVSITAEEREALAADEGFVAVDRELELKGLRAIKAGWGNPGIEWGEAYPSLAARLAELEAEEKTVHIAFHISDQLCADILCTALEGGIGYWSAADDIVKQTGTDPGCIVTDYVSCTLHPAENDEDFEPVVLDYAAIRRGIARVLSPGFQVSSLIADYVRRGVAENDAGHIDADAADCIVQAGVLGEITFG